MYLCGINQRVGNMELSNGKGTRASKEMLDRGTQKRNELERMSDSHWMVLELAKGKTYKEIADMMAVKGSVAISVSQVRYDIEQAVVEWKRENMGNIDAVIGRELARIELLERKVMEDYEKSKNLRAVEYAAMLKRGFTMDEIDQMFAGKVPGNPQFMEVLMHLQMQKLKILGIDKGNDVPTNTIVQYNFGALNEAQLAAMADRMQDAKAAEMLREAAVDEQ